MSRTTRRRRARRPRRSAETPEDADAAQEPERRVRPREMPVGAGAAAAPEAERAGWAGDPRNPFNIPRRGDSAQVVAPRGPPRPPDRWVREEYEVETGRVVHQETIEGEPPRDAERHEYIIPH